MTFGVACRNCAGFQGSLLYMCTVISWSLKIKSTAIACESLGIPFLHPLLPPAKLCLVTSVSILSGKLFPLSYFSVKVPFRRCLFGWFPHSGVAIEISLWLMVSGTPLTFIGTSSQAYLFVMSSTNRTRVVDDWLFAYYWNPSKKLKGYLVLSDLHWQL